MMTSTLTKNIEVKTRRGYIFMSLTKVYLEHRILEQFK